MSARPRTSLGKNSPPNESELIGRIARRDQAAFETMMRQHNSRLFRVARSILKDDAEAEEAVQDAYLEAYRAIATFRGESRLSTWLTRIVVTQSLMRLRRHRRDPTVVPFAHPDDRAAGSVVPDVADERNESQADAVMRAEVRRMLERRIDELPVAFRTVFVMRDVEDLTVEETATCLAIPAATVRTRLFRARSLLRAALARDMDAATLEIFGFAGERCDRIVATVLARAQAM